MEGILQIVVGYLIIVIESCGALVIFAGAIKAIIGYFRRCVLNRTTTDISELRLQLGQSMVMALEFQVAADILKTGISPTWQDILLLAAIIGLRTVLNYLLEREIELLTPTPPDEAPDTCEAIPTE